VAPILVAAFSALLFGTADYCGGRATQRCSALSVTVASQLFGLPFLLLLLILLPGRLHAIDVAWGAAAGAASLFAIVLLYRSLATGAMVIAAPITAVTAALLPLGVGLTLQRWPPAIGLAGVGCAVVAIALVSVGPTGGDGRASIRVVGRALAAGTLVGVFFALLAQTHNDSGMWPLVCARIVSITLGVTLVVRRRVPLRPPRAIVALATVAGLGDLAASALYVLATHDGLLAIVGPIAALYPASTVLLALSLDRERVRGTQILGLGLAATALVLTTM
jgi:uncharacterized membrane protein